VKFPKRSKRAAVLGCGPAGLFATHALIEKGWSVTIYSKRRKSEMFGAQYLHAPIPGLTESEAQTIHYNLAGTVGTYREKIYGANAVTVSVEALEEMHPAWDIREAYDNAWSRYFPLIEDQDVTPSFLLALTGNDLLVNSIPLNSLCYQRDAHQFHQTSIWAYGDAPERGQFASYRPEPFTVECDGTPDHAWYRASNVFGYVSMEWPGGKRPPLPGVAQVVKPIFTDCSCYQSRKFINVGRYGSWTKGVLSHQAYETAAKL
jgi:hypothetical protein